MIYVAQAENGLIKIGISADPHKRLHTISLYSPLQVRLIAVFDGDRATESDLHSSFQPHRRHNEWFAPEGAVAAFVERVWGRGLSFVADWVADHNHLRQSNKDRAKISRAEKHRKMWADPEYRRHRAALRAVSDASTEAA
jgi:hypothetical protein